jgi:hypothetical protein
MKVDSGCLNKLILQDAIKKLDLNKTEEKFRNFTLINLFLIYYSIMK